MTFSHRLSPTAPRWRTYTARPLHAMEEEQRVTAIAVDAVVSLVGRFQRRAQNDVRIQMNKPRHKGDRHSLGSRSATPQHSPNQLWRTLVLGVLMAEEDWG